MTLFNTLELIARRQRNVSENAMKSMNATPGPMRLHRRTLCLAVGLLLGGASLTAMAQDAAPSPNATINLIRLMVKKGLITQTDADGLLAQANAEAQQASQADQEAGKVAEATNHDGAQPGDVRVAYVPQSVRNEIRNEVKQEVVAQAVNEHWFQPNALPDWLDRISWFGDIKVRDESWLYSRSNYPSFIDYATLNRNGPYDVNSGTNRKNPPILTSQQNRLNMLRMQTHLGMSIKMGDTITAGVRLGSGNDNNPVSTTQTLGGGFDKKNLWLDWAWIKWKPTDWVSVTGGRMPNPFFATDLIYSPELNFDGISSHFDFKLNDGVSTFATLGLFPINYTNNDSPEDAIGVDTSNQPNGVDARKYHSLNQYLSAAQIGANFKFAEDVSWKVALAYYYFQGMRGSLSAPCQLYGGAVDFCSTDDNAPAYMQKGNTVFLLRDILPDPNSPDNYAQPQLAGLSYNYRLASFTNQVDFKVGETPVRVQADYVRNMAYHARSAFDRYPDGLGQPINNYGASITSSDGTVVSTGPYKSGPVGWLVRGIVGNPHPMALNEWNVALGYKYLQPDAVLDGVTDQNFHLGGTNAKGFIFTADYGIAPGTWLSARYFNAKQVYGQPFALDIVQFEISTKF
jgi:hypothetical protein